MRTSYDGAGAFPGPGSYNVASKGTQGPKYVMGLKGADVNKGRYYVPGPGNY